MFLYLLLFPAANNKKIAALSSVWDRFVLEIMILMSCEEDVANHPSFAVL